MKPSPELLTWIIEADPSLMFLVQRDLLQNQDTKLLSKIGKSGWAKRLLSEQQINGHWGLGYYRPKWACTHYTLLELMDLSLPRGIQTIDTIIKKILGEQKASDGGISFWQGYINSDICVDAMVLAYASFFLGSCPEMESIIDLLLKSQMADGGWNCRWLHKAVHSSFHTTQSTLEGIYEYRYHGGEYRAKELDLAFAKGIEFLLVHHLYKSHQSLTPVDPKMMLFSYPPRWRYDVLRSLYFLAKIGFSYDERMLSALHLLLKKRNEDGTWNMNNRHTGKVFFHMEQVGKPSRWNTYRALYVLSRYANNILSTDLGTNILDT